MVVVVRPVPNRVCRRSFFRLALMEPFYQEFSQIFTEISYESRRKNYRGPLQDIHQSNSSLSAKGIGVKSASRVILVYFTGYFNTIPDVDKNEKGVRDS